MPINSKVRRFWPRPSAQKAPTSDGSSTAEYDYCTFRQAVRKLAEVHKEAFANGHAGTTIYQFIIDFEKLLLLCFFRRDAPSDHGLSLLSDGLGGEGAIVAVTYFSWEPREHIFQVRRTYPTTVGLASYSVCYPEWGAVGEMLDVLRMMSPRYRQQFPVKLFYIHAKGYIHRALPYLAEPAKHKFDHILAIPVFRPGSYGYKKWQNNEIAWFGDELLGIFLTFIHAKPSDEAANQTLNDAVNESDFRLLMHAFTDGVGEVLLAQERAIHPPDLFKNSPANEWRKLKEPERDCIFQLTIRNTSAEAPPSGSALPSPRLTVRSLAAFIIHALRGRWCIVIDEDLAAPNGARFLAAPSKDLVMECGRDSNHVLRCLNSDLDRGLRSIGLMGHEEAFTYRQVVKHFQLNVSAVTDDNPD